ncbi:hypothetical protein NDU88_001759 [Pleurodeles waltl]|uniref:Uncharacterized protein n=1 Tax=Pleurodeles waltl TaxID=8319 RepID=A0AAV7SBB4_PLEWA|nr:hypothetical protein NDU88_001759 [Pleurodeles waltl]
MRVKFSCVKGFRAPSFRGRLGSSFFLRSLASISPPGSGRVTSRDTRALRPSDRARSGLQLRSLWSPRSFRGPGLRARSLLPSGYRISSLRFQRRSAASRAGPRALSPKLLPVLRRSDHGAPLRITAFFVCGFSRPPTAAVPSRRAGGEGGTSLSTAPAVPGAPGRQRPSVRACSGLECQMPPLCSAGRNLPQPLPRVSDLDPRGSERAPTAPESRLMTRGGQLWWQDSGG